MTRRGVAGLALLLSFAAVPAWVGVNSRDLARVDDADLLAVPPLAEGPNGADDLERAAEQLAWAGDRFLEGPLHRAAYPDQNQTYADPGLAQIEAWLVRAHDALALADLALIRPVLQLEREPWPTEFRWNYPPPPRRIDRWRPLSVLLQVRAVHARREGQHERALEHALELLELGTRIQQGASSIGDFLITGTMRRNALREVSRNLPYLTLTAERARATADLLVDLQERGGSWRGIWLGEYQDTIEMLDRAAQERSDGGCLIAISCTVPIPLPASFLFQLRRTQALYADDYRRLATRATEPCREPKPHYEGDRGALTTWLAAVRPNGLGLEHHRSFDPGRTGTWEARRCELDAFFAATRIGVGVIAYERVTGKLLASLAALVPDYLDALPIDPFGAGELHYAPEQRAVWSIGSDLIDQGGLEQPTVYSLEALREPTFWVPVPIT